MDQKIDYAKVKQAKSAGYSESDILDYLSKKNPELSEKITTALSSGHKASEVLNYLSPEPSKLRSLISAPIKGIVKGIGDIGSLGAPIALQDEPFEDRMKMLEVGEKAKEKFEKGTLENLLPTREGFVENALERGGKILPTAAMSGNLIASGIRSLLAGFAGETVKEAGGGSIAQAVGEIATLGAPGFGKNIISKRSQKDIVDFARKYGMTESELTPLLQSKKKLGFFGKMAKKGEKSEEALKKTLDARKAIYSKLEQSPSAKAPISNQVAEDFLNETSSLLEKLPSSVREKAFQDYMDLAKKLKTGKANVADFMNLWTDLNYEISQGSKGLGILKDPIENVFKKASPGFSQDFEMTRELYKRFYPVAKKLKPGISDELMDAGELGTLLYGVAKGKFGLITEVLGIDTARRLSREMLINPRFQNLHLQMVNALNQNKLSVAKQVFDRMMEESNQDKSKQQSGK